MVLELSVPTTVCFGAGMLILELLLPRDSLSTVIQQYPCPKKFGNFREGVIMLADLRIA
jgi:hypothetical protein